MLDKPPPLDLISDPIDMGDEEYTAAAATAGGQVYTWGYGDVGQLGHGLGFVPVGIDNVGQRVMVPTPVRALEGVDAVKVSASRYHALAVSRDGRVYTWGGGLYGQLGHGDRYPRFEPTLVAALIRVNITDAVAGTRHTVRGCDLGEVYAWGSNEFGELGVDPRPVKPNEGMANPTLTLRGWLFGDAPTPSYAANPPPPTASPGAPSGKKRRSVLGMDTEEDPTGKFDVIFERLRDDVDESGRSGMTHASFGALIAGVKPAIPPPWENVQRHPGRIGQPEVWLDAGSIERQRRRRRVPHAPTTGSGPRSGQRGGRRRRVHPRGAQSVQARDLPRSGHGRVRRLLPGDLQR